MAIVLQLNHYTSETVGSQLNQAARHFVQSCTKKNGIMNYEYICFTNFH